MNILTVFGGKDVKQKLGSPETFMNSWNRVYKMKVELCLLREKKITWNDILFVFPTFLHFVK